jgi:hypothetical protein
MCKRLPSWKSELIRFPGFVNKFQISQAVSYGGKPDEKSCIYILGCQDNLVFCGRICSEIVGVFRGPSWKQICIACITW